MSDSEMNTFVLSVSRLYFYDRITKEDVYNLLRSGTINGDEYKYIMSRKEV